MSLLQVGLWNLGIVLVLMVALWVASLVKRDASIVDLFWGAGFVVIAWATFVQTADPGTRAVLLVALTTVWGLRLTGYLTWRNWGREEDYRYRAMRDKHGGNFRWISLFTVFGLQGLLMWVVSWPVQAGQSAAASLRPLDILGFGVWLVGIVFEAVGDYQLARFKRDPDNAGRVMREGLWRYTRHPNYFGDFCVWWGLYAIAVAGGAWWTAFGPALMTFLLLRFSGVALLEKTITERRPEYAEYMRQTNAFFPGRPKSAG